MTSLYSGSNQSVECDFCVRAFPLPPTRFQYASSVWGIQREAQVCIRRHQGPCIQTIEPNAHTPIQYTPTSLLRRIHTHTNTHRGNRNRRHESKHVSLSHFSSHHQHLIHQRNCAVFCVVFARCAYSYSCPNDDSNIYITQHSKTID